MKLHLTERALAEVSLDGVKRSIKVFDTEVTGFGAQLTKKGTGSYFVSFRDRDGRQCHEKLAKMGAMAAHHARSLARVRLNEVATSKGERQVVRRTTGKTVSCFFYETFIPKLRGEQRNYQAHASMFRNHVEPALGQLRLDDVTEHHVVEMRDALLKKPVADGKWATQVGQTLADSTVKRVMILVRHIFNVALKEKVAGLHENPTRHLRLTTMRKVKGTFMTKDELQRLICVVEKRDPGYLEMVKLMVLTGLRRGNVLNMRWEWVNLEQGSVQVPPEADKAKQGFTKYLSQQALAILVQRFERLQVGQVGGEWVFPNPKTGKPYSSRRSMWETCRKEAGLGKLRYHDLRHTFASMMLESGSDIIDVQKALGHTQLKTTAVYLHLTEARKREKADAAAEQMGF